MPHDTNDLKNSDFQPEGRKQDHIELAFASATEAAMNDDRFSYEPMLSAHLSALEPTEFLGKTFNAPFWVSSMTGGTEKASKINKNLATVAGRFGFGMGLGSCRSLLYSNEHLADFDVRKYLGDKMPLYANLGIAQVEQLIANGNVQVIKDLVKKVSADGLIVHVNPLQEWLQPSGDRFTTSPIETIKQLLEKLDLPVIVKEVGQGMGMKSMEELLKLPLEAIEFAAFGGTNFAKLELMRGSKEGMEASMSLARVGHTAHEMIQYIDELEWRLKEDMLCKQFIISGGVRNFLDGYYLMEQLPYPCVIGQASTMLKYAQESEEALSNFVQQQINGLLFAKAFLKIK